MYSKPLLHIRILHHPVRVYFAIMTGLLYVIMLYCTVAWKKYQYFVSNC